MTNPHLNKLISMNEQGQANAWEWWQLTPENIKDRLVDAMIERIKGQPQDDVWIIYRLAWLKFCEFAETDIRQRTGDKDVSGSTSESAD